MQSTLATLMFCGLTLLASSSQAGASFLQWPHHGAYIFTNHVLPSWMRDQGGVRRTIDERQDHGEGDTGALHRTWSVLLAYF